MQPTKTRTYARRKATEPTQSVSTHSEHWLYKGVRMKLTDPGPPQQLPVKTVTSPGDVHDVLLLPATPQSQLPLPPYSLLICLPLQMPLFPSIPIIIQICPPSHTSTKLSNAYEKQQVSLCRALWLCCISSQILTAFSFPTSQGKSHPLNYFHLSSAWANSVAVPRA